MDALQSLRRNFAGVCHPGVATPLARFLAWRCAIAMPHPASPGFDESALGSAFEALRELLARPGADSSDVWAWSARFKGLGALPGWRPSGPASSWGIDPEDGAPTGPLDGFGFFEGKSNPWPWREVSGEARESLGASKVWIGALSQSKRAGIDLAAALSAARLIRMSGFDPAQGLAGSCLALAAPLGASSRGDWAMAGGPDQVEAIAMAWASGLDARWGAKLREPSGMASEAPRALRPNPINKAARRAMLCPKGRLPPEWTSSHARAWSLSLAWGVMGQSPSFFDMFARRYKAMAWASQKTMQAARSLPDLV